MIKIGKRNLNWINLGMLKEEIKNIKSSRNELKQFGLIIGAVLLLIGGYRCWKIHLDYHYFLISGGLMALAALIFPVILKPFQKLWMALALILGWLMSRLVLATVFYFILTPVSLIAKIIGKKFLELRSSKSQKSYWNYRQSAAIAKIDLEKQF